MIFNGGGGDYGVCHAEGDFQAVFFYVDQGPMSDVFGQGERLKVKSDKKPLMIRDSFLSRDPWSNSM